MKSKPPPPPKPPLAKGPPISGVLSETVPPGTATALPAAVIPSDQSKCNTFKQFKGQGKFPDSSVGLPVTHNTFQCELSVQEKSLQLNPSSCASIVSEGHATTRSLSQFRC